MKIKGITIDLGVNTKPVTEGFTAINKELNQTNKTLNDINKGLKLDPKNTELLEQKTRYLTKAIDETKKKLEEENKILAELEKKDGGTGKYQQQIDALKREIVDTTNKQKDYENQLKEVGNATEETTQDTKSFEDQMLSANLKTELLKAGLTAAAEAFKALVGFIKEAITASAEYADNILTQSKVTGLSTDALQEYYYMSELVDVSVDTISGSMTKLEKNMYSAANGSKSSAKYFEQLGVSVTDSDGQLRDADEVFGEIIDTLGQMTNETERDALAMNVFGKSAKELNPLILAGSESLDAFRQEAYDMGYVLDNETLESLGDMDDSFKRLQNASTTLKNKIGSVLAPVITNITNAFLKWASSVDWEALQAKASQFTEKLSAMFNAIMPIIIDLAQAILPVLTTVLSTIFSIIGKIVEWLGKLWQYLKDRGVIDAFRAAFESVGRVIQSVVGWVQDLFGWFGNLISRAREFLGLQSNLAGTRSAYDRGGGYRSGGFMSGGLNVYSTINVNNNGSTITDADVMNWADAITQRLNDNLGRLV